MPSKIYLNLFLCTILSQIIGTLSKENVEKSLKLHVRQKRLIDTTENAHRPTPYDEAAYVVNIKKNDIFICTGALLSNRYVVNPFSCVNESELALYKVYTGNANLYEGYPHDIWQKIDYIPHHNLYEIALLALQPRLGILPTQSRPIGLNMGPVPLEDRRFVISGWGRNTVSSHVILDELLRSITVPLIHNNLCADIYREHFNITIRHICSFSVHLGQRCGADDLGVPIVFFNHLVGILVFAGIVQGAHYPDVFINLNFPPYHSWISSYLAAERVEYREQESIDNAFLRQQTAALRHSLKKKSG